MPSHPRGSSEPSPCRGMAAATTREGWGGLERNGSMDSEGKGKLFLTGDVNNAVCALDLTILNWDSSPNWPSTKILPVLLPSCLLEGHQPKCNCPPDPHGMQPQPEECPFPLGSSREEDVECLHTHSSQHYSPHPTFCWRLGVPGTQLSRDKQL